MTVAAPFSPFPFRGDRRRGRRFPGEGGLRDGRHRCWCWCWCRGGLPPCCWCWCWSRGRRRRDSRGRSGKGRSLGVQDVGVGPGRGGHKSPRDQDLQTPSLEEGGRRGFPPPVLGVLVSELRHLPELFSGEEPRCRDDPGRLLEFPDLDVGLQALRERDQGLPEELPKGRRLLKS
jgi:hypothetical protein